MPQDRRRSFWSNISSCLHENGIRLKLRRIVTRRVLMKIGMEGGNKITAWIRIKPPKTPCSHDTCSNRCTNRLLRWDGTPTIQSSHVHCITCMHVLVSRKLRKSTWKFWHKLMVLWILNYINSFSHFSYNIPDTSLPLSLYHVDVTNDQYKSTKHQSYLPRQKN